jgi:hypothetical protein
MCSTRVALSDFAASGVKTTVTVQEAPGARVVQSFVWLKSRAPLLMITASETVTFLEVVLVAVIGNELEVFTVWEVEKFNTVLGDRTTGLPTARLKSSVASVASGAARPMVPVESVPEGG